MNAVARCPFCDSSCERALTARDTNHFASSGETFDYYRCAACGLWFLSPVPADLHTRYPEDYYTLPTREQFEAGFAPERYKVDLLRAHRPQGSLLEIGPASGYFAGAAKRAGYDVSVIEMDPRCCDYMRAYGGIGVHQSADVPGTLRTLPSFDVIALWHVIEHLPDPWATLRAIADRLAPGGVMAFATPNPDALQFQLLGARWTHLDAPRHVYLLPIQQMTSFVRGLGLRVLEVTCRDEGSLHWNEFGWEHSIGHLWMRQRWRLGKLGKAIGTLTAPLEERGAKGSAYTLLAIKD
jgi:2-polyprenyl-3-methyl-5-hydroxy-6-metoxy-1,4-benzoquinol methylase